VPFTGDLAEAEAMASRLRELRLGESDELLVVDNTPSGVAVELDIGPRGRVVRSPVAESAYAARNVGAGLARNSWLLFIDADCRPAPGLLDAYFEREPAADWGAIGGEVLAAPEQTSLAARYARSRGYLTIDVGRSYPHLPMAPTANVLVRRSVWEALGGFPEGMTAAGGDIYFSWRLQGEGWRLCFCPRAEVHHLHRADLIGLVRQVARNEAGAAWINRLYRGAIPRPAAISGIGRALAGAAWFAATRRHVRAKFKLVDGLVIVGQVFGLLLGHAAPFQLQPAGFVLLAGEFPTRGAAVAEPRRDPADTGRRHIEAMRRAVDPDWAAVRGIPVWFWEDDGVGRRAFDGAWLIARHPVRCLRDRRTVRRLACTLNEPAPTPLSSLAVPARRIYLSGARVLEVPKGDRAQATGRRLAALSGVSYRTSVR